MEKTVRHMAGFRFRQTRLKQALFKRTWFMQTLLKQACGGLLFFAFCAFCLFSCIGTGADINLRQDGSGTLKLEYRMAKDLESLGKFDGNERWPPLPAGRADMERSVKRIEGLSLRSFSSREEGKDLVNSFQLEFSNTEALSAFLDSTGQKVRIDMRGRRVVLTFPGMAYTDNEFKELVSGALSGYVFSLSFTVPGQARGRWLDPAKPDFPLNAIFPGRPEIRGNLVRFSAPMAEMVFLPESAVLEISW